jgi:glycosyltransferase involved in cell wall biosynthesis
VKKRILIMTTAMQVDGGVENSFLRMLSVIDTDKYDITVYHESQGQDVSDLLPSGIKSYVIPITCSKMFDYVDGFLLEDKILLEAPPIQEEYDCAIAFFLGMNGFMHYYVAEKVKAKVKVAWLRSQISKTVDYFPLRKCYQKYDHIFGVAQYCVDEFVELFPEFAQKASVFRNIISTDMIKARSLQGTGFPDCFGGLRILTVGRLNYQKGYDLAVPLLARLIKEGYIIKWYAVGDGDQRCDIEKLIKQYGVEDKFILLGATSNPHVYMDQCDLYVQPSRFEGYCGATNEARILNKPVITTDVSGAREQFIDGETGIIVDFDEEQLYKAVKRLLDDKGLRDRLTDSLSKQKIDTTNEIQKLYDVINNPSVDV